MLGGIPDGQVRRQPPLERSVGIANGPWYALVRVEPESVRRKRSGGEVVSQDVEARWISPLSRQPKIEGEVETQTAGRRRRPGAVGDTADCGEAVEAQPRVRR
jgi:hypothetical protein